MALRVKQPLPSFSGVAAGQTATVDVPVRGTYYNIALEYRESGTLANQATIEAAITEIRVKINGQVQRRFSAEDLIDINAYHGITYQNGYLVIFFAEPWARHEKSEDVLAWGTADVQSFQIEVDIDAGATAPTLSATAIKTQENRNLGAIKKWLKYNVAVAGTGITNYQTLPRTDSYATIHAKSANISDVKVLVDRSEVFNLTAAQNTQDLNNIPHLKPQTGYFHVDFNATGRIEDLLLMVRTEVKNGKLQAAGRVQDFQIDFNMSSATSFNLITETIGLV
jgi:hypothetical protein